MPEPLVPRFGAGCLSDVVPALLDRGGGVPSWMPASVADASQVVLLVLDGLGWEQLGERPSAAPFLSSMTGGVITSVAPSTTSVALTSIVSGRPPAQHGIVGYRFHIGRQRVLNVLRWRTGQGEGADVVPPDQFASGPAFLGADPPVLTKAEFAGTGFTLAHLPGARLHGWRAASSIAVETGRLLRAGEPLIYAYYDGVDKVAHERGFGPHYDAEVRAADRLVEDVAAELPAGAVLVVTADHGQVQVGGSDVVLDDDLLGDIAFMSGEGRFRWLHAVPGTARRLAERARERLEGQAWVRTRDEAVAEGWFGGPLAEDVAGRFGDVVLAPHAPVSYVDPADTGESRLVCRHGSLTPAEMLVPLLAWRA